MLTDNVTLISLIISSIIALIMFIFISLSRSKSQLKQSFLITIGSLFLWCLGLIAQITLSSKFDINPMNFDYFVYIFICTTPVFLLYTSLIFANTKVTLSLRYVSLFIIPILSILILWTNNYHHLFYVEYSTNFNQTIYGPYFNLHSLYSYGCIGIGMIYLIVFSIKNSGFFSRQSLMIIIGILIPLVINILATFNIIPMSIYITPISFTIGIVFYAFAMLKFQLLNIAPIALQRIVDRISDGYIVLNEEYKIIDFNKTFISMFNLEESRIRKIDIIDLLNKMPACDTLDEEKFMEFINSVKNTDNTILQESYFADINKHFNIEINSISSKGIFLGTLMLFKDITEHIEDMEQLDESKNTLIEKERLASLGALVGGIAHNLKTPIMSISGATKGISNLVNEYECSIGDPDVSAEDHHSIANEMKQWLKSIDEQSSYMSDVISTVKSQATTLSSEEKEHFTIEDLINRVNILMQHELKYALIKLNMYIHVPKTLQLYGNMNSLIQIINNMILNSIQSYEGRKNENIDFSVYKQKDELIIYIKDYGPRNT